MATRVFNRCLALCAAAVLLGSAASAMADEGGRIVYYDPDANHQAIRQLSTWFNAFLRSRALNLTLQPVQTRRDFEAILADDKTSLALVSSLVLREKRTKQLDPFLVPSASGDAFYSKVLVDNGIGESGNLAGKSIAATVTVESGGESKSDVLRSLAGSGLKLTDAKPIPVSKDIDALLALSFGQVQAALVTPDSLAVLKRINPTAALKIRAVYRTEPILRSPLCEVGKSMSEADRKKLIEALVTMSADDSGKKALVMMGVDNWTAFSPEMLAR